MDSDSRKPMLLVFAGPNGSGKTTIFQNFDRVGEYTNADDVVSSTGMDNKEAAEFVEKKRYDSIKRKSDFTFETVLSSDYSMNILREAKKSGYFIKCVFVLTSDPDLNVLRIKSRVALGGHDVERETVRKRFYKSLANIKELLSLCDILHVYDNTNDNTNDKVIAPRIIRKHKESITIFPNENWSEKEILSLIDGTYPSRSI